MNKTHAQGLLALSPLAVFAIFYLAISVYINDFYKIPITVAFLVTSIYAIAVVGRGSVNQRVETFCQGAGTPNIMLMVIIFILSGAFAATAKATGCIDATVNMTLTLLPGNMIVAGLFIASCFVSLSIGTSVGTIVALVPIAAGLAEHTSLSTAFLAAIIVGGAFFGDNLSFISDTTIMATKTQGCLMSDKFKTNIYIALPAAIIALALYIMLGMNVESAETTDPLNPVLILPYLTVIITALLGLNVLLVLVIGIGLCVAIALATGTTGVFALIASMGEGMMNMSELIIVTLLAAGLLETINQSQGIQYLINLMTRRIHGRRGAELSIGMLVSLTNICTANNTIAILTVGEIAKNISHQYGLDPRKVASILDTFSCFIQSLLPYGAQLLIAAALAHLSPVAIIPHLYYPLLLGLFALLSILLRYPRKYS